MSEEITKETDFRTCIAIAEGWTKLKFYNGLNSIMGTSPGGYPDIEVPNYTGCLQDIVDATQRMLDRHDDAFGLPYNLVLCRICGEGWVWQADCMQRCEAFIQAYQMLKFGPPLLEIPDPR